MRIIVIDMLCSVIRCVCVCLPRIQHVLGSGNFGEVNKGEWQCKEGVVEVAVKTLKKDSSEDDIVRFLQEAAIMGQFLHPNIVQLLGVVTLGERVSTTSHDLCLFTKQCSLPL